MTAVWSGGCGPSGMLKGEAGMMLEKAAKECLWAKPNDSWGTVCGIYQVSQGAGEKHGNK